MRKPTSPTPRNHPPLFHKPDLFLSNKIANQHQEITETEGQMIDLESLGNVGIAMTTGCWATNALL
jgi:hypothetical protein